MNADKQLCSEGLLAGKTLFEKLGFLISFSKSVFIPCQIIEFLGLLLDSIRMIVMLTQRKTVKVRDLCLSMVNQKFMSIRDLSKLIGNIVACLPVAQYGRLHYRHLERFKIKSLKESGGNWDAICSPTKLERSEIQWWIDNIDDIFSPIIILPVDYTIQIDACDYQWGGVFDGQVAQGLFSELLAVKYTIEAFANILENSHVLVQSDNTTEVSYVKKMGGTKHSLRNQITLDLWNFAIEHNIWLSISHIPGLDNYRTDNASRVIYNPRTEWALDSKVFEEIVKDLGQVDIHMFASAINHKLDSYVAWQPDPNALHIDAFTLNWEGKNLYIFPPFSLMASVVHKLQLTPNVTGILVYAVWPTRNPPSVYNRLAICIQPLTYYGDRGHTYAMVENIYIDAK